MASTVYLTTAAAPYTPATIRGSWDQTAGAIVRALNAETKAGGGAITSIGVAETNAAANFDVLLGRWVSGPLAAQTSGGTVDVVLGVVESNAAANLAFQVHVYVTQGDSDTPRGTLLSDYVETTAEEWPTTAAGRAFAAAQSISALAVSDGDRLVVEIEYVALNASASSFTGTLRYGTLLSDGISEANDLSAGGANVTTEAGFIGFNDTIAWSTTSVLRLTHVAAEASEDGPTAQARLTHLSAEAMEDGGSALSQLWLTPHGGSHDG